MDGIAQQTGTPDEPKGMELLVQIVKNLRKTAKETQESKTTAVCVNGRICNITAVYNAGQKIEITAEYIYTPLGSRICQQVANFTYGKSTVSDNLTMMVHQIDETDQTNARTKAGKITEFTAVLDKYVSNGIDIADLPTLTPEIKKVLDDVQAFVQKSDLSSDEMSTLKAALVGFGSNEKLIRFSDESLSINENYYDYNCLGIALQIEAIEMLLDAKEKGCVGLERNGQPQTLGQGRYNVVQLAYAKKNKEGPIVLKPCDLSKQRQDASTFAHAAQSMQLLIGPACGSYGRNRATSRLQDMFCNIGKKNGINVPCVMASVFAAEIYGVPCIAMERLDGPLLGQALCAGEIPCDNSFTCRATWIQVQDILTGQIDRHPNNVIQTKDGLVAIDHDLSFLTCPPRSFASIIPEVIVMPTDRIEDGHPVETAVDGVKTSSYCMPPVIDSEMYTVIMGIDLNELGEMYRECNLTRLQIKTAMARAQALKKKVEELKNKQLVIEPNEWAQSEQVKTHCNARNFYAKWYLSFRHRAMEQQRIDREQEEGPFSSR
ncbi:MAG: hypothetical protein LBS22_02960 [Puniceicoccales bacterium]|jgi:hypothetical protein|nr:hypothetical protein [Puniceicoccales bacterium]